MKMRSSNRAILTAALLAVGGLSSSALAAQQANIPDFYQHQFWQELPGASGPINGWEANGGWCRYIAMEDALYYWQVQAPYTNLDAKDVAAPADISTPGTWLPTSADWIHGIVQNSGADINTYLNYAGFGPASAAVNKLQSTNFTIDPATGQVTQVLAGGAEVMKDKGGVAYSPTQVYQQEIDKGRSSVLTVKQTAASAGNGLWWGWHCVAGAGYNGANILVADPDSNNGNQAANAGWYNLTPGGAWDKTAPGIAAAVARVQGNQFTAAEEAASPPIAGNAKGGGNNYAVSDVYGTWNFDAKGVVSKSDNLGGADNGRYAGVQLTRMEMISPIVAKMAAPAPMGGGDFSEQLDLDGEQDSTIDQIEVFPVNPLSDSTFNFDESGWSETEVTTDPWGYSHSGGGEYIDDISGSMLTPADDALDTFDTLGADTAVDVFMHDSLTDTWIAESIGAPTPPAIDYDQQTPEPASVGLLTAGLAALLTRRTKRTA